MGNNLSSDTPSASNSIKKLNPNIRWYISDKLFSETGVAAYNPFPVDVSFKIEEAYQSNQYYHSDKDDDTMIFFDYEHQEKHHLFIGKPQEERSANRGECPYPYACCF